MSETVRKPQVFVQKGRAQSPNKTSATVSICRSHHRTRLDSAALVGTRDLGGSDYSCAVEKPFYRDVLVVVY